MNIIKLDMPTRELFFGNILLVGCCILYLIWWGVAFSPDKKESRWVAVLLLAATAFVGILSLGYIIRGVVTVERPVPLFEPIYIVLVGLAAYLVLMLVTRYAFKRPVTTELVLIVGWLALAMSELSVLHCSGLFSFRVTLVLCTTALVAFLVSLVCYVLYYRLEKSVSYFVGMVPLISAAIATAGITAAIAMQAK